MHYQLNAGISESVGRTLFISGARRTGTSMMANLVHSAREVELVFEPPLLRALIPLIDRVDENDWRLLFEAYLFEDFLMDALAGRRMNFNENDDSCIYNVKSKEDIAQRLSASHRNQTTFPIAYKRQIALKLPDMIPYLPRIREIYPETNFLIMLRAPHDVITSILRLRWFTDERLRDISGEWPRLPERAVAVPHWIAEIDAGRWEAMSPIERCCFYYDAIHSAISNDLAGQIVCYDDFIRAPVRQFERIMEAFDLKPGELTKERLQRVHGPNHNQPTTLGELPHEWNARLTETYERCRALALTA